MIIQGPSTIEKQKLEDIVAKRKQLPLIAMLVLLIIVSLNLLPESYSGMQVTLQSAGLLAGLAHLLYVSFALRCPRCSGWIAIPKCPSCGLKLEGNKE